MIEVLKQALEAFDDRSSLMKWQSARESLRQAIAELESQEPVAVWELFEDGWDSIADPEWMESLPIGTKLYTRPPQRTEPVCPECKAKVLYECVACSSNNYPPQRTEPIQSLQCFHCQVTIETLNDKVMHLLAERKPLTNDEIQQIVLTAHGKQDWTLVFARAIEAAHGIKENT
jgi:hypothetical protein